MSPAPGKRVLLITYYWPPSGGAGVQRMLKLAKYLRECGWEPVVYTAENASYPVLDDSLVKDVPPAMRVYRRKAWEAYGWYRLLIGSKSAHATQVDFLTPDRSCSPARRISLWIRGNLFIPDARCFWIRPSIRFLVRELRRNPVDALLSSGPPHSAHMIAMGLKRRLGLPWLADFRDPWTQIDFYERLMLSTRADAKHRELEKKVLQSADAVMTIGRHIAAGLEGIRRGKVEVVTNGFDEDDFATAQVGAESSDRAVSKTCAGDQGPEGREPGTGGRENGESIGLHAGGRRHVAWETAPARFTITHTGSINHDRNAPALWQALMDLCRQNEAFRNDLIIRLAGHNSLSVYESLRQCGLEACLERIDYQPHECSSALQQEASVLLLLVNDTPGAEGIVTGKVFEYLAAGRPILVIGPEQGEAARIVREAGAGESCGFRDRDKIRATLSEWHRRHLEGGLFVHPSGIEKYSRRNIARQVARLLDSIVSA